MSKQASFCNVCYSIAHEIDVYYRFLKDISNNEKQHLAYLEERIAPRKIALGSLENLQSKSQCKSCQDIAHQLILRGNQPSVETVFNFTFHPHPLQGLYISPDPWSSLPGLNLWRIGEAEKAHEVGRIFNTQQINMNLLRQWIRCCDLSHQDRCIVTGLPLPMHHIYLIDVEEGCLVHAAANARYIALSYVWGDNQTVQTTKSNLVNFKKPKSIGADVSSVKIANTIRDALRLVSLLGERYLWVECLCIVQEDVDTKQLHLNSMASIYSNAHFTIVAADGQNADYGLRGFAASTQARAVRCDFVRYPYETDMILSHPQSWYPEGSPWAARGWTFQESLFSRRILIFNGLVSWVCRRAVWQEHVNSPTEDEAYAATHEPHELRIHLAADYPTWPDLDSWAYMVEEFNKRKLTYDEDVIDAFSGTTSVFNRQFSGGILCGIPESVSLTISSAAEYVLRSLHNMASYDSTSPESVQLFAFR